MKLFHPKNSSIWVTFGGNLVVGWFLFIQNHSGINKPPQVPSVCWPPQLSTKPSFYHAPIFGPLKWGQLLVFCAWFQVKGGDWWDGPLWFPWYQFMLSFYCCLLIVSYIYIYVMLAYWLKVWLVFHVVSPRGCCNGPPRVSNQPRPPFHSSKGTSTKSGPESFVSTKDAATKIVGRLNGVSCTWRIISN